MDNVLFIVGLIAIAIAFASLTPRPRIRQRKPVKSVALPPPLPPNVGEEERHIAEAVEAAGWEADEASTNEVGAIQDRLAKARDLVSKSGMDSAACDILGMIQYWPNLLETKNGQPPLPVGPLDEGRMPAQRHGAQEGKWFGWSWNGIPYRLELSDSANNSSAFDVDLDTGDLQLWVKSEPRNAPRRT